MISCRESSKLLCRNVLAVEWKELKKATEITKLDHVRNITHWTGGVGPYSSGLRVLAYTSDVPASPGLDVICRINLYELIKHISKS